ncbi:hypothetical protein F3Y22_tig00110777pilonHSYRG00084 [Hibiscus syriacus]|uniref:RING-type E3 ubiquitin transferase n=1 Tax=Hibiscus syriacus TaxID=106335 RepID=A0A6A2ZSV8_HIBSY|nr:hypothetical protein F3Y22_tig00110777pilonHSYRG00084 [Hibiscus syriacus]
MMREPSMLVRETAAEQLEERQSDWAYSKPVVVLDIIWNLAFVVVAFGVLVWSRDERPDIPLRLWIIGYPFQCFLHMVCFVWSISGGGGGRARSTAHLMQGGKGFEPWIEGEFRAVRVISPIGRGWWQVYNYLILRVTLVFDDLEKLMVVLDLLLIG